MCVSEVVHKGCLQCLNSVGGIWLEGNPTVGILIGDVPLFLQGMDREGTLSLQLFLFSSGVHLEEHAQILV